jgi:hypothetical protein
MGEHYRPGWLTFKSARRTKAGTFLCFSEVSAMDRAAMIKALTAKGFDQSLLTDAIPDPVLAEMLRVGGTQNDDDGMDMADADLDKPDALPPEAKDDATKQKYAERAKKYAERAAKFAARGKKFAARCGESSAPPAPGKDDADSIIDPPPIADKHAEKRIKAAEERLARIEKFAEDRERDEKRKSVSRRMDDLVAAGKVLPAQRDAGLDELAMAQDMTKVSKFSENGTTVERTAFDQFFAALEAGPVLMHFGDRFRDPKNAQALTGDKAKISKFCERFSRDLALTGVTKDDYLKNYDASTPEQRAATMREIDAALRN